MILPFSPEPFTSANFIPLSKAIFFANGEAKIRPPELFVVTGDLVSTVFSSIFSSIFSSFFSGEVVSSLEELSI